MKTIGKIFLLCFLLVVSKVYAQPGWTVNPGSYDYSMTITGVINLNYTEEKDVNNMVGAFVGGVCRGVGQAVYDAQVNRYVVYLLVYSSASNETVDFKVYDASSGLTVAIPKTMQFEVNKITGTSEAPYFWSNPTLSSEANMLTFGFTGQTTATVFDTTSINVEMPAGTNASNLVANYTTSPNALVKVGATTQTSGVTINNFTNPVVYNIVAADETTRKNYTVYVSIANGVPSDITLSANTVAENAALNAVIGTFSTTDVDLADTHTYSLVAGLGDADNSKFSISGNTLLLNTVLDYETKTSYSIRLKTEDQKGGAFEKTVTISVTDVNDEAPQWNADSVTISEDMMLQSIYTIAATDADVSPLFTVLSYSITAGNAEGNFSVNTSTGVVTLIKSLDYETTKTYTLTLKISDGVNTTLSSLKVIVTNVNDENPIIKVLDGNLQVDEMLSVGSDIYSVIAADPDNNSALVYSITAGNAEGKFVIDPATGKITLFRALDYETTKTYKLTVSVNDGINSSSSFVTIDVIDQNDETPIPQSSVVFVPENAALGSTVHTVIATDADKNSVLRYDIFSGNDLAKFAINKYSGKITLISALDYETLTNYTLEIIVTDGVNDSTCLIDVFVTDVNDNAPRLKDSTITVSENALVGDALLIVQATDADANSTFTYSIASGNQAGQFAIGSSSGLVTLVGNLDYETKPKHVLEIKVSDGINSSTALLIINVRDEDDEIPVLNDTTLWVSEFANIGEQVGKLVANDVDAGSSILFSLDASSSDAPFAVDAKGIVRVDSYLDYEKESKYQITVKVSDGVNFNTGKVTIYVTNESESIFKAVNVFTPNNDGVNDYWEVENSYLYRDCEFIIYNHIQEVVYRSKGYDNSWNGLSTKGEELPIGTYYYVVNCANCKDCNSVGFISIVR